MSHASLHQAVRLLDFLSFTNLRHPDAPVTCLRRRRRRECAPDRVLPVRTGAGRDVLHAGITTIVPNDQGGLHSLLK